MSSFGVSRYLAARFRISSIAATARCRRSLEGIDSSNDAADGDGVGSDGGGVAVEDSFGVGVGVGIVVIIATEGRVDSEEVPFDDGGGGGGSATTVTELFGVSVVVASFFFSFLCCFFVTSAESGQGGGWEEGVLGGQGHGWSAGGWGRRARRVVVVFYLAPFSKAGQIHAGTKGGCGSPESSVE